MTKLKTCALAIVWVAVVGVAGFLPQQIRAQKPTAVATAYAYQTMYVKSKLMGRDMPYRVIFPKDYSVDYRVKTESRYPVIYLLHGLTGHFTNWTEKTKVADYAAAYGVIIVTPEGDNGWYSDSVSTLNDKYESYIMQELIPEIDTKYRTLADRDHRMIAGLSMGGYGAIKFGLKYPDKFSLIGSFSGALGAAGWTQKNAGTIAISMDSVFGADESSSARKANDVFAMIREITPEKVKALPYIYEACGTDDFLIQNNRDFMALMLEKKIPHEYRQHPGGHDWVFWDDQVREFLALAERRLKK